jgi:hypothetical protein
MMPPRSPISMCRSAGVNTSGRGRSPGRDSHRRSRWRRFAGSGQSETGPVVKLAVIVDELHVAGPEAHLQMQRRVIGERVEHVERRDVIRRQAHGVRKTLGAVDVLALVEHGQVALRAS